MKNIAGLLLLCSIGMCCLAIPISEPFDDMDEMFGMSTIRATGRDLLRMRRPSPAPAPPRAAPRAAPAPPRAAPAPPRAAPAPPRAAPAPPRAAPRAARRVSLAVPTKKSIVKAIKKQLKSKPVPNKQITKRSSTLNTWLSTSVGASAVTFCNSLGIRQNVDVYDGCLEDIRVTKSEAIAKESAVSAMEFAAKDNGASPSKRFCVASGDPHCTNYDGDYFHIQEPGIYTIATSRDGVFDVQEKMRKNGANRVGVPSCMIGALVRYKQVTIEADVSNFGKIRANGIELVLKRDETIKIGGVSIRYGNQNVEWRDTKSSTLGLKLSTPEGFGVLVSGGYCGILETSVPTNYYGRMGGICGNADGAKNAADYFSPDGVVMNVNRGAKQWEMSGYNGPNSPLSKWQLAWRPVGSYCYFTTGCETGPTTFASVSPKTANKLISRVVAPIAKVVAPIAKVVAPIAKVVAPIAKVVAPIAKVVAPIAKVVAKVKSNGFKVYGNYCGPNYCGGQKFKGAEGPQCKWGVTPKDPLDACCKIHDQCCGTSTSRGTNCNKEILVCIDGAKCKGAKCEISKAAIKMTFSTFKNSVCGDVMGSGKKNKSIKEPISSPASPASPPASPMVSKPSTSKTSNDRSQIVTGPKVVSRTDVSVSSSSKKRTFNDNAVPVPIKRVDATSTTSPKDDIVKEIIDTIPKTNTNLDKFQKKLKSILTEMDSDQLHLEAENHNNFNGASITLKNEQLRLEASRKQMTFLYDEVAHLNATIQTHYKKLIADTDYLQTLDAMRPAFLTSLSAIASNIQAIKTTVDKKIVNDEYKDEMVTLLTGIHANTKNISGYVATAFINHYNKYKTLIKTENVDYSDELKQLSKLANEYALQSQKTEYIEKERASITKALIKFRDVLTLSVYQHEEFELLVKEIGSIFERTRKSCTTGPKTKLKK